MRVLLVLFPAISSPWSSLVSGLLFRSQHGCWLVLGCSGRGWLVGIDFDESPSQLKARKRNIGSASQIPGVVDAYLMEMHLDRVVPVSAEDGLHVHTSPFGVIHKKINSGRWQLIVNLPPLGHECERQDREGPVLTRICLY